MKSNSIEIFPWDDNFNTGLPQIDEQHRQLVHLLNLLASHVAYSADARVLGQIFDQLTEHATQHFAVEEALWHELLAGDIAEQEHRATHQTMAQQVADFRGLLGGRPLQEVAEEILRFLANWLASHILDSDRYLATLVLACRQGLSREAAEMRAQEQTTGAGRELASAIRSIYATLAANTLHLMHELAEHRKDKQELLLSRTALQASEANLQAFFDTVDDLLFVFDQSGRILQINQAAVRRLGYPACQLIGREAVELHPQERRDEARRITADLLAGTCEVCHIPLQTANGELIPVETRLAQGLWNGQPAVFGVSRDVSERDRVQRLAAKQARLLEQYFDHALIALALLDRNFNFVRVNAVYAQADDRDVADFPGHNHFDFYPSEARDLFEAAVRTKQPFQSKARPFEYADHPERGVSYWDIALMPLLDPHGEVEHLLLSLHDVTEQKRAEQVARQSAARYRSLVDHLPMLVWQKDVDGVFVTCNRGYAAAFGREPEDMVGHTDRDFYSADLAEQFRVTDQRVMEDGSTDVFEGPWMLRGELRWLRSTKLRLIDDQGKVYGTLGFAQDLTDRKEQEVERDQTLALLQTVIEHVPVRIFWKDRKLNYLGCNPLFARDAGRQRPADMVGQDDLHMGWAHEAELYRADDRHVIETGTARINFEEPQTRPDGSTVWLRTSKVPLRDGKGDVFGVLGLYDDITAQKQAEEQMRSQFDELRRWQDVMLDREERILDVKREVNELLARLGEPPRYASAVDGKDEP